MPRRKVKLDTKVKVMRESLRLAGGSDILRKYGVSRRAAYNWYRRVLESLPEVLADQPPGPKPKSKAESTPPF
jgi:hypothetical protein